MRRVHGNERLVLIAIGCIVGSHFVDHCVCISKCLQNTCTFFKTISSLVFDYFLNVSVDSTCDTFFFARIDNQNDRARGMQQNMIVGH